MKQASPRSRQRSRRLPLLALASLLGVAAGTGNAAAEVLPEINLHLTPWTAVAREKGFFKEVFDKIGTKKINLIASGGAELIGAETAAVGGGALAIAQRMIYPATVHRANGLDGVLVWVSEPSNRYRAPILARADNDQINTVADLDGRRFGSSRISCYWSSPFEQLTEAEQRAILTDRGFEAWQAGDYPREKWTTTRSTEGWRDSQAPSRPPAA